MAAPRRRQEKLAAKREEEVRSSPDSRGDAPSTAHASPASSPSMSATKPPQVKRASPCTLHCVAIERRRMSHAMLFEATAACGDRFALAYLTPCGAFSSTLF